MRRPQNGVLARSLAQLVPEMEPQEQASARILGRQSTSRTRALRQNLPWRAGSLTVHPTRQWGADSSCIRNPPTRSRHLSSYQTLERMPASE